MTQVPRLSAPALARIAQHRELLRRRPRLEAGGNATRSAVRSPAILTHPTHSLAIRSAIRSPAVRLLRVRRSARAWCRPGDAGLATRSAGRRKSSLAPAASCAASARRSTSAWHTRAAAVCSRYIHSPRTVLCKAVQFDRANASAAGCRSASTGSSAAPPLCGACAASAASRQALRSTVLRPERRPPVPYEGALPFSSATACNP